MAEVIRMPRMSDTMEEGVIVGWLKNVGDTVEPGDVLAEVETDKATMELENYHDGVLLHIGVKEGAVPVNGVLAVIGEKGEDYKAVLAAAQADNSNGNGDAAAPSAETSAPPAAPAEAKASKAVETAPATTMGHANADNRVKASPLARSIASEAGIDLSAVQGSGDNGRIIKRDIEQYMNAPAPAAQPASKDAPAAVPAFNYGGGEDTHEDIPLSQMRKVIARRLGESKYSAPHFYLTVEINMGNSIEARKRINEIAPTRISFNDIVVKAVAVALRQHPAINSSWTGESIRRNHAINIGVAVAVDEGLLVPVLRHADMKSLSQLNVETKALAEKARSRKLQPNEMSGNTFTVSNLGMFGIEEFTAIINPPDACILAVGGIIEKAIVVDGELAVGKMMKVTLSCDHRVVDGATGAKFLNTLKDILEAPIRLLV